MAKHAVLMHLGVVRSKKKWRFHLKESPAGHGEWYKRYVVNGPSSIQSTAVKSAVRKLSRKPLTIGQIKSALRQLEDEFGIVISDFAN